MKVLIKSGIPRYGIINYFKSIKDIKELNSEYVGNGWRVFVAEEKFITMSVITMYSTDLEFYGDDESVDLAVAAYRLNFLSAGG